MPHGIWKKQKYANNDRKRITINIATYNAKTVLTEEKLFEMEIKYLKLNRQNRS